MTSAIVKRNALPLKLPIFFSCLKEVFRNPKKCVGAEFRFRGVVTACRLPQSDFPERDKVIPIPRPFLLYEYTGEKWHESLVLIYQPFYHIRRIQLHPALRCHMPSLISAWGQGALACVR